MGPGFHLAYAQRLAWRARLLLALATALLGLLLPPLARLSPLWLLLPARLWEGQALRVIARVSLAYPTALAYGEARLWEAARKVEIPLPPFPLSLLLLYLLVLLLALALPLKAGTSPLFPPQAPSLGSPTLGESPGGEAPNPTPQGEVGKGEEGTPQEEGSPGTGPVEEPKDQGPGEGQGDPEGLRGEGTGEGDPSPGAQGGPPSPRPGTGEGEPHLEEPQEVAVRPQGEAQGLLEGGGEGGKALPSPWPEGRPPERVVRGAEVYLERTPLPEEARELIRRYFRGEGP